MRSRVYPKRTEPCHFSIVKPTKCISFSICFGIVHSTCLLASKQPPEPVWHIPDAVCTVLDSWWWTERPSETCRVYHSKTNWEIVHLVGFTIEIYHDARSYVAKSDIFLSIYVMDYWYADSPPRPPYEHSTGFACTALFLHFAASVARQPDLNSVTFMTRM
jgi:hypothetical protein